MTLKTSPIERARNFTSKLYLKKNLNSDKKYFFDIEKKSSEKNLTKNHNFRDFSKNDPKNFVCQKIGKKNCQKKDIFFKK
mgnify:CR=1 FL=1